MRVERWIEPPVSSLLDVGCNVGAWLADCAALYPCARLAGVDINETALRIARAPQSSVEWLRAGAESLPFQDSTFQYVTCIETLEHLPAGLRAAALREIWRVLKPGGRLILTVPHAGWFAALDSNNLRFRFPALYRRFIGAGLKDQSYIALKREVEWHHHFTDREVLDLAGPDWTVVAVRHRGLILCPVADLLSWPFYRLGRPHHPVRLLFQRIAGWELGFDFGPALYGLMMMFERR